MSVMERRLQLLLDRERYERVHAEALRSGRSVAAVIRQAIDISFPGDADLRVEAARRLLAVVTPGAEPDWQDTKRALEADGQVA
ncbi:MAG: antitoxin [Micropruina sp.]|nr:antitoxin [Micropruina sp.]